MAEWSIFMDMPLINDQILICQIPKIWSDALFILSDTGTNATTKDTFCNFNLQQFYYSVDKQNPLEKLHSYTTYGCIKIPSHF